MRAVLPPFFAEAGFEALGVPSAVAQRLRDKGFVRATRVQAAALPVLLRESRDVVFTAETGSGKTIAFVCALLARIGTGRGVILVPTQELVA